MAVEVTLQGAVEDRKETIERGVTFQVDSDFFYVLDDEAERIVAFRKSDVKEARVI